MAFFFGGSREQHLRHLERAEEEIDAFFRWQWIQWRHLWTTASPGVQKEMRAYIAKRRQQGRVVPYSMTNERAFRWDQASAKEWRAIIKATDIAVRKRRVMQRVRAHDENVLLAQMADIADDVDFARAFFAENE